MSELTIRLYNGISGVSTQEGYTDLDVDNNSTSIKVDISSIQTDGIGEVFSLGSQEFVLPSTTTNDEFFNYTFDVGSDERGNIFKKRFKAQILIDGGVATDGYLYLNGITTNNGGKTMYKCSFNDSVPALGDVLNGVLLSDLNWVDYDHAFNISSITASWDNNLFNGDILYPNIFYGYTDNDTEYQYSRDGDLSIFEDGNLPHSDFKPAIRVKTILDKIFSTIGYEYSSSFFNEDSDILDVDGMSMNDLYMLATPSSQKGVIDDVPQYFLGDRQTQIVLPEQNINETNIQALVPNHQDTNRRGGIAGWDILVSSSLQDTNNAYDPISGIYTIPANGDYEIINEFSFINTQASSISDFYYVQYNVNGARRFHAGNYLSGNNSLNNVNASTTLNGLEAGDEVEFIFYTYRVYNSSPHIIEIQQGILEIENQHAIPDVAFMDLQLTEVKALDFIKAIQEQFNLVIWSDRQDSSKILIETYDKWIASGNTLDWSNKVDYTKGIDIKHPTHDSEDVLRFENASDEEDTELVRYKDIYSKEFGAFIYESDSDYSKGEKVVGGKLFAPTIVKPLPSSESSTPESTMVIPHIVKLENEEEGYKPIKFKPRLLFNNGKKTILQNDGVSPRNYSIVGLFGDVVETNEYLQMSPLTTLEDDFSKFDVNFNGGEYEWHIDDIPTLDHNTNKNSFNYFWANRVNQTYRNSSRKVKLNINMRPTDYFEFNTNDTIFIDGHDYIIDKISGFNFLKPQSVQVELIKKQTSLRQFPIYSIGGNTPYSPISPIRSASGVEIILQPDSDGLVSPIDVNDESNIISSSDIPTRYILNQGFIKNSSGVIKRNTIKQNGLKSSRLSSNNQEFKNNNVRSVGKSIGIKGVNNVVGSGVDSVSIVGNDNVIDGGTRKVFTLSSGSEYGVGQEGIYNLGGDDVVISGSNVQDLLIVGNENTANLAVSKSFYIEDSSNIGVVNNYDVELDIKSGSQQVFVLNNEDVAVKNVDRTALINNQHVVAVGSGSVSSRQTYINNRGFRVPEETSGSVYINNRSDVVDKDLAFTFSGSSDSTFIGHTPDINPDVYDNNLDASSYNDSVVVGKHYMMGSKYDGFNVLTLYQGDNYQVGEYENVILVGHRQDVSGVITITLPDISSNKMDGRRIILKASNTINSSYPCVVDGFGAQTIDGKIYFTLNAGYRLLEIMAIGGSWYVIS